ncbi:MAG: TlyA family RNA methyltransferase [Thermincolia bacterium]
MTKKKRIDILLVDKGLFPSRERAKTSIMAGRVLVNNQRVDKSGTEVPEDAEIRITGDDMPYVSRGGLKLAKAIKVFGLDLTDKVVLDIGASTGGFTHCALQNGARLVYAVDVGYGQLAWSLRQDSRVVNLERINIRYLDAGALEVTPELATIDVAFISLELVLPKAYELTGAGAQVVALVKPQFEAGREKVGKKGVVRDPQVHQEVLARVVVAAEETGFGVIDLSFSPIKGPEGNIEYLLLLDKSRPGENRVDDGKIAKVVEESLEID